MILLCFGTRPEFIKIKPLIKKFSKNNIKYRTLYIRQHTDLIQDIEFDYKINVESISDNRLNDITHSVLNKSKLFESFKYVLVQGDTTTCLAVAISSFNRNVKVIHLEAGLRTFDLENPYPEEGNRRLISQIASIHFCPTEVSKINLEKENIKDDVYVVGNTVLDNLKDLNLKDRSDIACDVLITIHRRENHSLIENWFLEINLLKEKFPFLNFVFIKHPNPNVLKYLDKLSNINVIDPLPRKELLKVLNRCKYLITDSGGLQEEASYFKVPTLVCRKVTERPEGLNNFSILCKNSKDLVRDFLKLLDLKLEGESPYGKGNTSELICKILKEKYC